jgi:hypothetical protein
VLGAIIDLAIDINAGAQKAVNKSHYHIRPWVNVLMQHNLHKDPRQGVAIFAIARILPLEYLSVLPVDSSWLCLSQAGGHRQPSYLDVETVP